MAKRLPRIAIVAAVAAMAALCVAALIGSVRERHDVVITHARIIDGTGAPAFDGALAFDGDRIARVWRGQPWIHPLARVLALDAGGRVVAPGFIDTHSHADLSIGDGGGEIRADNFAAQGVSTLVVGNCGRSPFRTREMEALIGRRGSNVNVATLAGLNSIRNRVMGAAKTPASPAERVALAGMVREEMEGGALGVSSGYAYVPGRFASVEEIVAELRAAARAGGVHATHLRDEGGGILRSVDEVLGASAAAGAPLLISHLKITGPANCVLYPRLLRKFRAYPRPLHFDQYPYAASSTSLELLLPDAFLQGSEREQERQLGRNPALVKSAIADYVHREAFGDLRFARIASYAPKRDWRGLTVDEVDRRFFGRAASTLSSQADVIIEMLRHGGAQMVYENICEDVMLRIPRDLPVMVGSDSAIRFNDGLSTPHPRGWGTFPRVVREFVLERRLLRMEEAIRRMTDLPARFFGLSGRGRIVEGHFADVVVLDPDRLADRAAYADPFARPDGIDWLFVNGQAVVETRRRGWAGKEHEAVVTTALPGRFLRRQRARRNPATALFDVDQGGGASGSALVRAVLARMFNF